MFMCKVFFFRNGNQLYSLTSILKSVLEHKSVPLVNREATGRHQHVVVVVCGTSRYKPLKKRYVTHTVQVACLYTRNDAMKKSTMS